MPQGWADDIAVDAVEEALRRGFRVTTSTTCSMGTNPTSVRAFFDQMMELGVEGMMLSAGILYDKAPDQKKTPKGGRERGLDVPGDPVEPEEGVEFDLSPLIPEF